MSALDAVNTALANKWTDRFVYVDFLPKNFQRPSFLLEQVATRTTPLTRHTVERTVQLTIVCFVAVNDYNQQSQITLLSLQAEVISLFDCGYVMDGERALTVSASSGGSDLGVAFVDLTVTYTDDKTETTATYQKMQKININYKGDA